MGLFLFPSWAVLCCVEAAAALEGLASARASTRKASGSRKGNGPFPSSSTELLIWVIHLQNCITIKLGVGFFSSQYVLHLRAVEFLLLLLVAFSSEQCFHILSNNPCFLVFQYFQVRPNLIYFTQGKPSCVAVQSLHFGQELHVHPAAL